MKTHFSKLGFVLAVAGGAVGLGNAWKFPTLTAQNGGFAFVLLYLFFTLSIGLSIFLAELAMGRLSRSDLASAYESLAIRGKKQWKFAGIFMLGGIFVLSFYLMIMGWVLKYTIFSLFYLPKSLEEAGTNFNLLISQELSLSVFFYLISFFLTLFVVSKGIIKGIERLNLIIMPSLFLMLLSMLIFCLFFEKGFGEAFSYLFSPNLAHFKLTSVLEALGLSLFTLCLGIGCIVTYSAALDKKTNFIKSSLFVVFINIIISLMMGLIVFTFIFEFDANPATQGAGLVFVALTSLFTHFGIFGNFLASYFFLALFFAGITSAVSMIEPLVFYFINHLKISRKKALFYLGSLVLVLGMLCILSLNADFARSLSFFHLSFFELLDKLASNILLPLGALASAIFVGFFVKKQSLYKLFSKFMSKRIFELWYFCLRFIAPLMIVVVMFYLFA
ncbi:sodium-dependent transporter [Campylobacter sp. MIT 99-7217]|uniref:sodium-dependent transporter n=1 Tax=Campylobacter sp. MIT 99-7217 TaxID=535091 RepID=UPI0011595712|nr:sodium-dependent transporter [Campylobacter sp. MIT 99-7217]TQR34612.1 sodium-dependent transporter [Campylobacter sp. MIT 99-7217]